MMSPNQMRKDKSQHRFVSNEGISTMNSQTLGIHLSTEHSKSQADTLYEERFLTQSGTYKTLKTERTLDQRKADFKPPLKPQGSGFPTPATGSTATNASGTGSSKTSVSRKVTNPTSLTSSATKSSAVPTTASSQQL
jgi:hypothetical protein